MSSRSQPFVAAKIPPPVSFGPYTLDLTRGALLRGMDEIKLRPKSYETLKYLVLNGGRLVPKSELIGALWPDAVSVSDDSLMHCIRDVRRALGDDGQEFIRTVPGRGYMFAAPIEVGAPRTISVQEEEPEQTERPTRFAGVAKPTKRVAAASVLVVLIVAGTVWVVKNSADRNRARASVQQLVFRGDFYIRKWTEPESRKAIEHYNRAIALDPKERGAYAGLATAWIFLSDVHAAPRVAMPKAKAAALSALRLDDRSAQNYVTLGVISVQYDWDFAKAESEFKRALQLDPHHMPAHALYGWYLMGIGRLNEAAAEMKRALEADPLNDFNLWELGLAYYFARQIDEAIEQYRRAIAVEPRSHLSHMFLGWALAEKGRFQEAISEVNQALRLDDNPQILASLGYVYALAGQRNDAQRVLGELHETAKRRYVSPYDIAPIYAALGDNEQALHWLERAYEDRSGWLAWWLKVDVRFDKLRSQQGFHNLLRRVGHTL